MERKMEKLKPEKPPYRLNETDNAIKREINNNELAKAFDLAYGTYKKRVLSTILRLVKNPDKAEDLAQQTWEHVFVHLKDFRGESSLNTWITRIAFNETGMDWRKEKKWQNLESLDEDLTEENGLPPLVLREKRLDPEQKFAAEENRRKIHDILHKYFDRLNDYRRRILISHFIEGKKLAEIAEAEGKSLAAIKSVIHKGLEELKELIPSSLKKELAASA